MAELPELIILARQMNEALAGKSIAVVEVPQPKCLNIPVDDFTAGLVGKSVVSVENRGKWLFLRLMPADYLLLNLGMGADLLYYAPGASLPDKYQLDVRLADGSGFTARFWWFGYVHLVPEDKLGEHKLTAGTGLSPLEPAFTEEYLAGLLRGRKMAVKTILMDQKNVAGIGNVYIQDTLFRARLHPLRPANSLTPDEVRALHQALRGVVEFSLSLNGAAYEKDFYGQKGGYGMEHLEVGYKEGQPCPACGTTIIKVKTGSTASYICPQCQAL